MSLVARDPARYDKAAYDNSRYDVLTSQYERALLAVKAFQTLTLKKISWMVERDDTTGHRDEPSFTDVEITGLFVVRGGVAPSFAGGYIVRNDAELWTLDNVRHVHKDRVVHPINNRLYEAVELIEEPLDPKNAEGFAFRHLRLHELPFRRG